MNMADEKALLALILWGLQQKHDYEDFIEAGGNWQDHVYTYAVHLAKSRRSQ